MIEHIVIFKFNEKTSEHEKKEAINQLKSLKQKIPGIVDIQAGLNFSDRSQGFDVGLTVRFEDKQSLEEYGPHEKHQEVVSYLKEIGLSDIIVVDFEL
ncbi:Dabb family protein [Pontibacillus yanchengensis]|uniref:Dabb family protein n=2 Tax=Pontibacillus yanchengensis TaxID=462910 RepID=A0ACC7VCR3_9BACI|nr:Dabb family protein [Pontibacillus yanchengensis]MYL35141.1 Dabb family protein [Pontibacillus yanchengensis]MYL52492.1 Dabb family protein [Pontibacillus yanchengensis]